jgi:hypothetical protein
LNSTAHITHNFKTGVYISLCLLFLCLQLSAFEHNIEHQFHHDETKCESCLTSALFGSATIPEKNIIARHAEHISVLPFFTGSSLSQSNLYTAYLALAPPVFA